MSGSWHDYHHDQYLRSWRLTVSGIVLTSTEEGYRYACRMTFKVRQADVHTPNTAIITVYNLKTETAQQVVLEGKTVTLEAGYLHGNYGIIFKGAVKQYKRGKESATDTYLTIYAADGDEAATDAWVSKTIAPTAGAKEQLKPLTDSMMAADPSLSIKFIDAPRGGPGGVDVKLARSRVYFGHSFQFLRTWQRTHDMAVSIQNGGIQAVRQDTYLPSEVVILNATTGMIGVPEATQDGVHVTCLLNPAIMVRGVIEISNAKTNQFGQPPEYATVAQYDVPGGGPVQGTQFPEYKSFNFYASVADDGRYCVLVIDYEGDTRGLPWYNHMVAWAIDASKQPGDGNVRIGDTGGG